LIQDAERSTSLLGNEPYRCTFRTRAYSCISELCKTPQGRLFACQLCDNGLKDTRAYCTGDALRWQCLAYAKAVVQTLIVILARLLREHNPARLIASYWAAYVSVPILRTVPVKDGRRVGLHEQLRRVSLSSIVEAPFEAFCCSTIHARSPTRHNASAHYTFWHGRHLLFKPIMNPAPLAQQALSSKRAMTYTRSPTRTMLGPSGTPFTPQHALPDKPFSSSMLARYPISTWDGTAESISPVSGSALGSCMMISDQPCLTGGAFMDAPGSADT
jgi:hypothetical protein